MVRVTAIACDASRERARTVFARARRDDGERSSRGVEDLVDALRRASEGTTDD